MQPRPLPTPPLFDDEESGKPLAAKCWLATLAALFRLCAVPSADRVCYAVCFLRGAPLRWWVGGVQEWERAGAPRDADPHKWRIFVDVFTEQFGDERSSGAGGGGQIRHGAVEG